MPGAQSINLIAATDTVTKRKPSLPHLSSRRWPRPAVRDKRSDHFSSLDPPSVVMDRSRQGGPGTLETMTPVSRAGARAWPGAGESGWATPCFRPQRTALPATAAFLLSPAALCTVYTVAADLDACCVGAVDKSDGCG
ncbi:hypothetical protein GGTG_11981 [Gaeumannomyces tritici R3-111a-1]|uniref:Uncharacterized protein n=1 Tax=Gaeumannomyces tritici (strain R3-111a-1) TaxID=644352 RepID=J3PEQ0_GAET3|nr:hypothetical protein GGTG_11981 [Gaeumannomyces tritici R3-111a-1]EJT70958.1 hypothetical protein GGTG_11981 [Gaeumannomyces tritici R3-111a-1]